MAEISGAPDDEALRRYLAGEITVEEYLGASTPQQPTEWAAGPLGAEAFDPIIGVGDLGHVDSKFSGFRFRADESALEPLLPAELTLESDIAELWYIEHVHSGLGPYGEMGLTLEVTRRGTGEKGPYSPYMYLTQDAAIDAGRMYGTLRPDAHIRLVNPAAGLGPDDEASERALYGEDYFSFSMARDGYLIHAATGRYDDAIIGGGRSLLFDPTMGRFVGASHDYNPPDTTPRVKDGSERTASAARIRWFAQPSTSRKLYAALSYRELFGLTTFRFDRTLPPDGRRA